MKRKLLPLLLMLATGVASAQTAPEAAPAAPEVVAAVDFADTAFVLICSALVLLMTPALAFFYGGLSRSKSVLNTMMMSFTAIGVITIVWVVAGYSIAFGDEPMGAYFGSFQNVMLAGIDKDSTATTFNAAHLIPKYVFVMFQATFAIIAAALISGALVDRMKFGAYIVFIALWSVLVYAPVAHWVWDASGWLFADGALDFAGGTVVHINAGVSALVAAKLLGPRLHTTKNGAIPHNIPFVLLGAGLLWFGWFGFNAGSALGADGNAGLAMLTTQVATAVALMTWIFWEKATGHAMSAVGAATGAVVGLVAITPAAGFVSPAYASVMVVEHAERFGLAQLHQLRGRVGRGAVHSHCILLFETPLSEIAKERLKVMYETTDGFEVARRDLHLRGAGEFLGVRQSGLPLLRFADLETDIALLEQARDAVDWLLTHDPNAAHMHLQRWLGNRAELLSV